MRAKGHINLISRAIIDLSIVIPSYNEEKNIPILYQRLLRAIEPITDIQNFEIIFVENGSFDNSWSILQNIVLNDTRVKVIKLTRNFGYQAAVTAGMKYSKGNNVVVMDGDLQDVPEFIPNLWNKKKEGFKIVYATRAKRKGHILKNMLYKLFYRILDALSTVKIPLDAGDFAIYDRIVIDEINNMPESQRFIRGLRAFTGYSHTGLPCLREERLHGKSKFPIGSMFQLAFDGILSFSYVPLRLLTVSGIMIAGISVIGILIQIAMKLYSLYANKPLVVLGITQVNILIIFFGGINLFGIGIIGEYLGRVYEEIKKRPLYIIEEIANSKE